MTTPGQLHFATRSCWLGGVFYLGYAVWLASASFLHAAGTEPQPVKVGAGSYAEFPPSGESGSRDGDKVGEVLAKKLYIDESKAGAPVPTNAWWTDLIVSRYCGDLWAHPLTVSASADGIRIFHPQRWTDDGNKMVLENPLEIGGEPAAPATGAAKPEADLLIADFESEHFPGGWRTTGAAFGDGPTAGAVPGQSAVSGFLGKRFANSHQPNDAAKGTLTSPPIRLERSHLYFLLAGGRRPVELRVKLLINGQIKRTATGENSERFKWQSWDVAEFKGAVATLEIEDNADGGWAHILVDQIIQSNAAEPPASSSPNGFGPVEARALNWSDWTVTMRLPHDPAQYMDVTVGHGLPFVWTEFKGVNPTIKLGPGAACFDANGAAAGATFAGDVLEIEYGGNSYGVFAPDNTVFKRDGDTLSVRFAAGANGTYLVVGALPAKADLAKFHQYAYAIPRDSRVDWNYDPAKGEIATHWTLETEALKGTNRDTIQGWIPHHYRGTNQKLAFNGITYATARGLMKCATGREFDIGFPFAGLVPNLPAPQRTGKPHDYDEARMKSYIADYAKRTEYGKDTYWGGKDVLCFARYMLMAKELGCPEYETLRATLRTALADWFTYTPGESAHYFAMYPRWKALVGFKNSYGSGAFNDQHFHYGYFTAAAGFLAMCDPQFAADYGEMAKLVGKEYANWDRQDARFPLLRTFDLWEGHSWAGGFSSPGGNNQESSSEAVQSWGGLFMLGSALNDQKMAAAGAMGWAMETAATNEYWFDYYGHVKGAAEGVFPPQYTRRTTGIFFAGGRAYATYFSGDPAWVYGIHWLPASPFLTYLGRDPDFARGQFKNMMEDRDKSVAKDNAAAAAKGKTDVPKQNTISAMGGAATVVLGFTMQYDPDWTAAQLDDLWAAHDPAATKDSMAGIIYYCTHANRMLGNVAWNSHTSVPTSSAYYNPGTKKTMWVVYNPGVAAQTMTAYTDGKPVGEVSVPAHSGSATSQLGAARK